MVLHLVLFKPRANLSEQDRAGLVAALERAITDIPTVLRVQVGRRLKFGAGYEQTSPDAADFLALIEFNDQPGLEAYLRHPAHEELGHRFNASIAAGFVYDFELTTTGELARIPDL